MMVRKPAIVDVVAGGPPERANGRSRGPSGDEVF